MTLAMAVTLLAPVAVTARAAIVTTAASAAPPPSALVPAIAAAVVTTPTKIAVAMVPPLALARGFLVTVLGLFFRRCIAPGPRRAQLECGQQALGQLIGRVAHAADTSDLAGNDKLALRQFERLFSGGFRSFDATMGRRVTALFIDQERENQPDGDETG
jgi:hypothetical protein